MMKSSKKLSAVLGLTYKLGKNIKASRTGVLQVKKRKNVRND